MSFILLGRTVVFEDIESATEMARKTKFRVKVVTLDGQVINAGGSFTGGYLGRSTGVFSRKKEIETLAAAYKKLKAELTPVDRLKKIRKKGNTAEEHSEEANG